jgi:hypothetical protein
MAKTKCLGDRLEIFNLEEDSAAQKDSNFNDNLI